VGRARRYLGTNELASFDVRSPVVKQALQPALRIGRPEGITATADGVPVKLEFSACRFGGCRAWLVCDCGSRWLVLYRRPLVTRIFRGDEVSETKSYLFRCRKCWHLTYPSQRASRDLLRTAQLRLEALCHRFKRDWSYGDDYFEKPLRVRYATWQRFCEAVEFWEERLAWDFVTTVERRFGRHVTR
jgi:hypothetical protein